MANTTYHDALRRRLQSIEEMGQAATGWAQNRARNQRAVVQRTTTPLNQGPVGSFKPSGNRENDAISFGRELEKMGYRVAENPHFASGKVGKHSKNSKHYSGRAFDVNWGRGGQSAQEKAMLARVVAMANQRGLRSIFNAPGHYGHAHIDW